MDLRRIIKEEVEGMEWTNEIPEAEIKTYSVVYRMEILIDAASQEEAEEIYYGLDLSNVTTVEDPIGVKYVGFVDDYDGVQVTGEGE